MVETEQHAELWERVAKKIKNESGHEYAADVLRKRYHQLEKRGFQVGDQLTVTSSWDVGGGGQNSNDDAQTNRPGSATDAEDAEDDNLNQSQDRNNSEGLEASLDEEDKTESTSPNIKVETASSTELPSFYSDPSNNVGSDDTLISASSDSRLGLVDYSVSEDEDGGEPQVRAREMNEANLLPFP